MLNFCDYSWAISDGIDYEKATEKKNHVLCLSSESQNYECLNKIEKCVNDVCRFSHYPALQKEALHKAVAMSVFFISNKEAAFWKRSTN